MLHQRQAFTCPCCHGYIGDAAPLAFVRDRISSGQQKVIFGTLARQIGRIVSKEALIGELWGGRRDGGPETASAIIGVQVSHIRRKISPYGWTITVNGGGRGTEAFYRLIPTEAGAC